MPPIQPGTASVSLIRSRNLVDKQGIRMHQ
jgi:hypothetical protein